MTYEDVEVPRPGPGEAQIKVAASGLNYLDVQYRIGRVKAPLPFVIGSEASGFVTEVGSGVTDLKIGDPVAWAMTLGSYAEYAVVPAWKLVVLPPDLDMKVAAGVMLQGLTAHYLTHSTFALQPGQTALVHAAAGGVGSVIVQVVDRGPAERVRADGVIIDVSRATAERLGFIRAGRTKVRVEVLKRGNGRK